MAGYNYRRGMTRNAVDAYRRNLTPISRFAAKTSATPTSASRLASPVGLPKRNTGNQSRGITYPSKFYNRVNLSSLASLRRHIPNPHPSANQRRLHV